MNGFFESIKLTAFEIMAYVLPGYISLVLTVYFFNIPNINMQSEYVLVFISSFILGHVVHNLSTVVTIKLTDIGWYIYHLLKEKDTDGKGVKEPQSILGKLIRNLRYKILEKFKEPTDKMASLANENLVAQDIVKSGLTGLDMFHVKEILFVRDERISEYFLFTHYYSVLCRSLSFIFSVICIGLSFMSFYSHQYGLPNILYILISGLLFEVFLNRHWFYKQYRSKLINAFAVQLKQ